MYTVDILAISMPVVVSCFIFTGILLNVTINTVCYGGVYGNHYTRTTYFARNRKVAFVI